MAHNVIIVSKTDMVAIMNSLARISEAKTVMKKLKRDHINLTKGQMKILARYCPADWKSSFEFEDRQWDKSEDCDAEIYVL